LPQRINAVNREFLACFEEMAFTCGWVNAIEPYPDTCAFYRDKRCIDWWLIAWC
jgi:hypothetical protein